MYLTSLKIKNYKLIEDSELTFQRGMNVLIGKNNTGKSTVLEALNFLLSPSANIILSDVIPYTKQNSNVTTIVEGTFKLSDIENIDCVNDMPENEKDEYSTLAKNFKLVSSKKIIKSGNSFVVQPNISISADTAADINKTSRILNWILPKFHLNNVVKLADSDSISSVPMLPMQQLVQNLPNNPSLIYQYLRSMLYEARQKGNGEYAAIRKTLLNAFTDIKDIDIEFNLNSAQINACFIPKSGNYKISLNGEGLGVQEFFYLFLTLFYFPDAVILKDEAFVHMHKSLLINFLSSIGEGQLYQMVTTSHIKELINSLDFGNIIICRKKDEYAEITNLLKNEDINEVLAELGYAGKPLSKTLINIKDEAKNVFG